MRKLLCDTHVILASGACWRGTESTPESSRSVGYVCDDGGGDEDSGVDGDGGQGSPFLYIQTPDQPLHGGR